MIIIAEQFTRAVIRSAQSSAINRCVKSASRPAPHILPVANSQLGANFHLPGEQRGRAIKRAGNAAVRRNLIPLPNETRISGGHNFTLISQPQSRSSRGERDVARRRTFPPEVSFVNLPPL